MYIDAYSIKVTGSQYNRKSKKTDKNVKKVDYEKMVALLTEAIKEQQTQIESLKGEVQELKSQLNN